MVARGAEIKTTPSKAKPAEPPAPADQSGGKPLPKAKFVDKVKASRKAKATPTRRAVENLLLEKAKAEQPAVATPAKPRKVISSIGKKTPRSAKVK
jgi:hypothetical protein